MTSTFSNNGNNTIEKDAARAGETIGAGANKLADNGRALARKVHNEVESRGEDMADEAKKNYQAVKQTASEYAERGEAMLRQQVERAPMQSLAMAIGIGFLAALLIRR